MRRSLVRLFSIAITFCGFAAAFAEPPSSSEPSARTLSKFETSLIGSWFGSGDASKHSYIASSGSNLFTISETKNTMDLIGDDDGTLLARRWKRKMTGKVIGDYILWSNGKWWSRQPMPPAPVDLTVWGDGTGGWVDLKKLTPTSMEENDFSNAGWKDPK